MKCVFFPGSFNPFTKGHADIIKRLLGLAERVVVGIGINIDKPSSSEEAHSNALKIREWIERKGLQERVEVIEYTGLSAEEAIARKAVCMARGVRGSSDFDYEYRLASINREAFGIETILIPADPLLSCVSSSALRDLEAHGRDDVAKKFIP